MFKLMESILNYTHGVTRMACNQRPKKLRLNKAMHGLGVAFAGLDEIERLADAYRVRSIAD
jgi:hypothetical protein